MKSVSKHLGVLLCLVCSSISFLTAPVTAQRMPPIEVPFDSLGDGKSPLFTVLVNGRRIAKFVFDTGANTCVITDKLVAQWGLKPTPAVTSTGKPFCDVDGKQFQAVTLSVQIGGWERVGSFMVVPEERIPFAQENSLGGLLGANILFDSSIYLDFAHQNMQVYDRRSPSAEDIKALAMTDAACLPLLNAEKFQPTVQVRFSESVQIDMRLDTGAAATFLPASVVAQLHLKSSAHSYDAPTLYGITHKYNVMVPKMWLGPLLVSNLEADWAKDAPVFLGNYIGMDVLRRFRMLLDYPAHKLYLKPVGEPATGPKGVQFTDKSVTVTLPLEYVERTQSPFVNLMLEDNKPYQFLLDTSATASLMDRSIAEQAKLSIEDTQNALGHKVSAVRSRLRFASDAQPQPVSAPMPQLEIPLIVEDLSDWRAGYPGAAGILGTNVLEKVAWQFDFGKKQITFFMPGGLPNTPQKPKNAVRLPLHQENGFILLDGDIDGRKTRFLVSTSQETQLRSPTTLAALKPLGRVALTYNADTKGMPQGRVRLHEISVGGLHWKQPIVNLYTGGEATQPDILGLNFLHQYRVTVDVPSKSLYLEPDPAYKELADNERGLGFTPHVNADKNLEIVSLVLPSPASEAGLKVGNVVTSVNGLPVKTTPIQQISAQVQNKPEGTVVRLVVLPKGEDKPREVTLRIRKLL